MDRAIMPRSEHLTAMSAMLVYSIPVSLASLVEAVVAFPGGNDPLRIGDALLEFENNLHHEHLIVPGVHPKVQRFFPGITEAEIRRHLKRNTGHLHTQVSALHTRDQADWLAQLVQSMQIRSFAFYAAPFHMHRAFLTVLKSLFRIGAQETIVIPVPFIVRPDELLPELQTTSLVLIPGELDRISEYQVSGDVATLAELEQYLSWLWQQEPLRQLSRFG